MRVIFNSPPPPNQRGKEGGKTMNYLDTRLKDIKNGYLQHFGILGMKWGWTKDGKRTGAKEAMTEQERAQRRKELLAKIGKGLGIAAGVAGAALAIKNRKAIGGALLKAKDKFTKKRTGLDNIKSNFSTLRKTLIRK